MAFDWKNYIDLADVLLKNHTESKHPEACYRAAISRAYYGVFIPAREWYSRTTGNSPEYQKHSVVISTICRDHRLRNLDKFRENLFRLMALRHMADYDTNPEEDINFATAETALGSARRLSEKINTLLSPPRFRIPSPASIGRSGLPRTLDYEQTFSKF